MALVIQLLCTVFAADIAQDQSSRSQVAAAEVHASPQEVNNEQAAEIETDTGMEEAEV